MLGLVGCLKKELALSQLRLLEKGAEKNAGVNRASLKKESGKMPVLGLVGGLKKETTFSQSRLLEKGFGKNASFRVG